MIRIGFFREFQGAASVLIDADQNGVAVLERVVRRLASGTGAIDITAERDVVGYGAIVLLAELSETSGRVTETNIMHKV